MLDRTLAALDGLDAIGVSRRVDRRYGTREEHDRELGLDAAGIRAG